jgi:hypothetical protein
LKQQDSTLQKLVHIRISWLKPEQKGVMNIASFFKIWSRRTSKTVECTIRTFRPVHERARDKKSKRRIRPLSKRSLSLVVEDHVALPIKSTRDLKRNES